MVHEYRITVKTHFHKITKKGPFFLRIDQKGALS